MSKSTKKDRKTKFYDKILPKNIVVKFTPYYTKQSCQNHQIKTDELNFITEFCPKNIIVKLNPFH